MNRRHFLERSALAAGGFLLAPGTTAAQAPTIGIQIGPVSFLD